MSVCNLNKCILFEVLFDFFRFYIDCKAPLLVELLGARKQNRLFDACFGVLD